MSQGRNLLFIAISLCFLSSCGYVVRESGFLDNDRPKDSYYSPKAIWQEPWIEISSSCDGTNYTATWGPYIVLPLFVIPNPFWPFTYYHHTTKDATLTLAIHSPPSTFDWNIVTTTLILNGKKLETDHIDDISKHYLEYHRYFYNSGLTCKRLDDSELEIYIDVPPQLSIKAKVLYKHRWRISFLGI